MCIRDSNKAKLRRTAATFYVITVSPSEKEPVSYTHLDVYKRQVVLSPSPSPPASGEIESSEHEAKDIAPMTHTIK